MGNLEEFEKKLYRPGAREEKLKSYEAYKEDEDIPVRRGGWNEADMRRRFLFHRLRRRVLFFASFLLVAAVVGGGYYYYLLGDTFRKEKVTVTVVGPDSITAGEEVSFVVSYRNDADIPLRDANIVFTWPERSVLTAGASEPHVKSRAALGTILPQQEKSVTFKGRIYGAKGEGKQVEARYQYTPEQSSSTFEDAETFSVKIAATPLALTLRAPAQVVADKEVELTMEYQNQSDASFADAALRVVYPADFHFVSADPEPSRDTALWEFGNIAPQENKTITIKGVFVGAQGEVKSVYAEIGAQLSDDQFVQYASADATVAIASSALIVFQTVNDSRDFSVAPGGSMTFKIRYKNTTNIQIPNVVILADIDPTYVDIKTLNVQWGSFDGRTNSIIWNAVGVSDLAVLDPKEEGQVQFSINAKPAVLPKSFSDKNLTVVSTAKITSSFSPTQLAGLPLESQDRVTVKIHTVFSLYERAYYADGLVQNTGPLPPKVGQRTTFAVSWQLTNTTNDVGDVEVKAVIPPNVEWTGVVSPPDADIHYDQNSGVVVWKPGTVFAGAGTLTPAQKVDFQLAFTPALVHVGQTISLISSASLTAADAFTGLSLERQAPAVNTDLLGTLSHGEGRVEQ